MTLINAIDTLLTLIQRYPDERRYPIELQAHMEVRDGDPFDEGRYSHANDRYAYRQGRSDAEARLRIEGRY